MKICLSVAALAAAASFSAADVILETEANNTLGTANFCGDFFEPGDSFVVDGAIGPGDVDWFRFTVEGPTELLAATRARPNNAPGDSVLGLFDSVGSPLAINDDDGPGLFSLISMDLTSGGTYYLAVSAFPDFGFVGAHESSEFNYKLIVGMNIVPTPGSTALLGLGGLAFARRRRA